MLELNEYICPKCGKNILAYQKWVQSKEELIIHGNGHIEYAEAVIDPDHELKYCNGYICQNCDKPLFYYGSLISTERDLITYLMLDQEEREEDERTYQALVQEQIEREIACGFKLFVSN